MAESAVEGTRGAPRSRSGRGAGSKVADTKAGGATAEGKVGDSELR